MLGKEIDILDSKYNCINILVIIMMMEDHQKIWDPNSDDLAPDFML